MLGFFVYKVKNVLVFHFWNAVFNIVIDFVRCYLTTMVAAAANSEDHR